MMNRKWWMSAWALAGAILGCLSLALDDGHLEIQRLLLLGAALAGTLALAVSVREWCVRRAGIGPVHRDSRLR